MTDATRIERLAPTIEALIAKGAKVVVMSHFGRPKGRRSGAIAAAAGRAAVAGDRRPEGAFAADCVGPEAERVVDALRPARSRCWKICVSTRRRRRTTRICEASRGARRCLCRRRVSAAHRAHASIAALAHLLPAAAGKNMQAELDALGAALEHPQHPVIALIGGAKVSTKLDLLKFMTGKVDKLAIGGAMANTFLFAQGRPVGRSLCERDMPIRRARSSATPEARLRDHPARGCGDCRKAGSRRGDPHGRGGRGAGDAMILDIGPQSVERIAAALDAAKTLVWNGPLGAFETPPFERGTTAIARKVAELTRPEN